MVQFIRKRQQSFTFNISGKEAGFNGISQWYFKIKRHTPKLDRIKYLTLNIHPADPKKPLEMWHIWKHLLDFCRGLASGRLIVQLTVNFLENRKSKWATCGMVSETLDLQGYTYSDICGNDVGQLLTTLCSFVDNIDKPIINLPRSYVDILRRTGEIDLSDFQGFVDDVKILMTGEWRDPEMISNFHGLERRIKARLPFHQRASGRLSTAMFEKQFGQVAILQIEELENFKREWPYMDLLFERERPLYRELCNAHGLTCTCDKTFIEVVIQDQTWTSEEWERQMKNYRQALRSKCNVGCPFLETISALPHEWRQSPVTSFRPSTTQRQTRRQRS